MGKIDRQKMAEAAKRVMRRPHTEITEVVEKDEDKGLTVTDRFAAASAAFLVCGCTYFALWLLMEVKLGGAAVGPEPAGWLWVWTWRLPFLLTGITTIAAFLKPGWTYRYFGKIVKPLEQLLNL